MLGPPKKNLRSTTYWSTPVVVQISKNNKYLYYNTFDGITNYDINIMENYILFYFKYVFN
jgi:hypothetical protein